MGRPRRVADQIAEELNENGQEPDPDAADDFGQKAVLEDSDDEQLQRQQRSLQTRRIRGGIELNELGNSYRGRRVSRAEAFGNGNGNGKDSGNDNESEGGMGEEPFSELSDGWGQDDSENELENGDVQHANGLANSHYDSDGSMSDQVDSESDQEADLEAAYTQMEAADEAADAKWTDRRTDRQIGRKSKASSRDAQQHAAAAVGGSKQDRRGVAAKQLLHAAGANAGKSAEESGGEYGESAGESSGEDDANEGMATPRGFNQGGASVEDDLEKAYAEMQAQDAAAMGALADRAAKERQKGKAVTAQQALWHKALELRVTLQRALPASNRLPLPQDMAVCTEASADLATALQDLQQVATDVLTDMCSLHDAVAAQHPAVGDAANAAGVAVPGPAPRGAPDGDLDALWGAICQCFDYFGPFRDASLDRWHRKVLLQNPAALKSGGLRALNQSISQQVKTLMDAPEPMLKRVRLPASSLKRIRLDTDSAATGPQEGPLEAEAPLEETAEGSLEELDEETFDDAEFYGGLLKDFLEAQGDAAGALAAALQQRTRKRKQVDRKASKGRKIRYHVHEKLVGFTAPMPLETTTMMTSQLFANLFGGNTVGGAAPVTN